MPIDDDELTSAQLLARRLLRNRPTEQRRSPQQPVVVLLGPATSGKSTAIDKISRDCGKGVVHASFDFGITAGRTEPVSTVEALTVIAHRFARKWKNRPSVRFTRFALGLLAIQTDLGADRDHARNKLRESIRNWSRIRHAETVADQLREVFSVIGALNVLPAPWAEALGLALPLLIRRTVRKPLGSAQRWHADIPEAEGAAPIDALIALNDIARNDRATMTSWLTQAFLADVRESHPRMAVGEPGARCACDDRKRHYHNWILLLDNLHHDGGIEFIADLQAARDRHAHPDDHDPLLVIASSGRWNPDWETTWRAPWQAAPLEADGLEAVPRCRAAKYEHWKNQANDANELPTYYPVLLEPLAHHEIAGILNVKSTSSACELAQRATGGLPGAVQALQPLLSADETLTPGARDVLGPSELPPGSPDPWRTRLAEMRLAAQLPNIGLDDFVSAAPFATAPWLVPANAPGRIPAPHVGSILTELRAALWVTAPSRGATTNYAELHPWVAQTLVSALVSRGRWAGQPSYPTQFRLLLQDQQLEGDEPDSLVRTAYCRLALGEVSDVVDYFTSEFDNGPHRDWIDRLRLVARAPSDEPFDRSSSELFAAWVDLDVRNRPERSHLRNVVARLVVALWLAKNPFAMPKKEMWQGIAHDYRLLPRESHRADVAALNAAAADADHGRL
jgi:hypothetical protein